jgi:hypothetical protein
MAATATLITELSDRQCDILMKELEKIDKQIKKRVDYVIQKHKMTKINFLSGDLIKFMENYNYYDQTLLNQLKLIIIIINIILKYNFIHPIVKN